MIEWLKKRSLQRQGLSCGKTRRQINEDDLRSYLDGSRSVRIALFVLTTLALIRIGMWQSAAPGHEVGILACIFMLVTVMVLPLSNPDSWRSNHHLLLIYGSLLFNLLLNKALFVYSGVIQIYDIAPTSLIVPSALGPMLVSILIAPRAGMLIAFLLALLGNIFIDSGPKFLMASLITGFAAAYFTQKIRRRSDLLMAGVAIGFVGLLCALVLGSLLRAQFAFLVVQCVWAGALGLLTAFIVSAILPVFEWIFDRITDISWLELTDLNHPLLRRLTVEAPGTYHHSLMVANLAESAAESIGANGTQCRVCSYFHDIGKLIKPDYFIENLSPDNNPHDSLSPSMSALIIISHVKEGVNLALKYRLRKPILDVIQQHHGTTLVYYFYKRAQQQEADARAGGKILKMREDDIPVVEERSFRYPGPIPQTKESAIVSLADSIESASRSLKSPSAQKVENLVREIVRQRVEDGQLDESNLSFNELATLTERFCFTLKTMLHARIEYPKARTEDPDKDTDTQPATPIPDLKAQASRSS